MLPSKFFSGQMVFEKIYVRIIWKIDRLLWLHPTPGINLIKLDSSLIKDVSTEVRDVLAKWFMRSFKKIFSHILQWKMSIVSSLYCLESWFYPESNFKLPKAASTIFIDFLANVFENKIFKDLKNNNPF